MLFMALLSLGAAGAVAFVGGGLYLFLASGPVQTAGASAFESFREVVNSPASDETYDYYHYHNTPAKIQRED